MLGAAPNSWSAALAPQVARKLAPCGVALPDARDEMFIAAWRMLGVDPARAREREVKAAADLIIRARAAVRLPVSRDPITAIAGGAVCLTFGDAAQAGIASRRSREGGAGFDIRFAEPREGGPMAIDALAEPRDAPHPKEAAALIDFLLRPAVAAEATAAAGLASAEADGAHGQFPGAVAGRRLRPEARPGRSKRNGREPALPSRRSTSRQASREASRGETSRRPSRQQADEDEAMTAGAPNILIVMADQMAPAFLPIYGHASTRAPHMHSLAEERRRVRQRLLRQPALLAFARLASWPGCLPSRTRVYDNAAEFSADIPTFAHHLRLRGYRTILSGKMHFCGPDQLHGFEERLTTDIYPADFGWTPDWDHPDERPSWYHNMSSVAEAGVCVRTNQLDFDDEVAFASERAIFDIARSNDRRPFLHRRLVHPSARSVRRPAALLGPLSRRGHRPARCGGPAGRARSAFAPPAPRLRDGRRAGDGGQVRNARHAYLGAIAYVDDQLGRLMQALARERLADDTIVILTSDHGEMLGERGLWYKMSFFEGASRVPLVVASPGRFAPAPRRAPACRWSICCRRWSILPAATPRRSGPSIDGRSLGAPSRRARRPRRGDRRISRRGRRCAAGDDPARRVQVHPFAGRPGPALRP